MIIGMPRLLISTFSPRGSIGSESSVLPGVPAEGAVNLDVELLSGSTYSWNCLTTTNITTSYTLTPETKYLQKVVYQ